MSTDRGEIVNVMARGQVGLYGRDPDGDQARDEEEYQDGKFRSLAMLTALEAAGYVVGKMPSRDDIAKDIQSALSVDAYVDEDGEIMGTGPASYKAADRILTRFRGEAK